MNYPDTNIENEILASDLQLILDEHHQLAKNISFDQLVAALPKIEQAKNIFLVGAGRTGFMIRAAAMRLMHLGYAVHVVGETTTPALSKGDFLIAASGSGTTSSIVKAAETARKQEAHILCFTTNANSALSELSDYTINIPAAGKQDHHSTVSQQYAGSLFEQSFLLVFDALIQFLWKQNGATAEELWKRHANME
ncbi:6-phospho-3-hexuloisomerase [Echinicola salinicaeni]|uniref:6-phospho-3-hexuloisomerase n=1 Tax=Echinicola salinicaeni TaxID=2762757 RepID=UPI001648C668|nr:6-phospho-3-hexuloisomerase [Echinicola salinicaeni]